MKIINRIPSTYGKHSFKRWFDEGALLGYDKEKGPAFLSSEHRSNSRSPRISPIDQTPTANDKKANPFAKVIVYQNDASVGDFYQKSISPVFNQAAYHGTAYTFDKFTLDHVGSGEGVQAHGWGLYFSLDRHIAEGYRSRVTSYRGVADELGRVFAGMDVTTREGMAKALSSAGDKLSPATRELLDALQEANWLGHENPMDAVQASLVAQIGKGKQTPRIKSAVEGLRN